MRETCKISYQQNHPTYRKPNIYTNRQDRQKTDTRTQTEQTDTQTGRTRILKQTDRSTDGEKGQADRQDKQDRKIHRQTDIQTGPVGHTDTQADRRL